MAKKIVEIDEEMLKGIMVSDVPVYGRVSKAPELEIANDAPEPESEPMAVAPAAPAEKPRPKRTPYRKKREEPSAYREKYLVNTPAPMRIQTYINREAYGRIKRFLSVMAPDVSITSYINNILSQHLEEHWDEINDIYENALNKPL